MIAISIRQPWAHHILHDGKDVENRSWPTKVRGRVLIHAGLTTVEAPETIRRLGLPLGGIVGSVEIVDCLDHSDSRWWCGPWGWVLRDPRPLPFVACRGKLGFFRPDLPAGTVLDG
ncbi:ASCH domain-containing protein [uncultured Rhodospira sp.]|uniref:ASCH domain-containing protein n=1 Tax=uncultured Rhodospira sp. TaxID=1936189 RepID=UPI0026299DD7|nr:ASCH domain-containing protein [uncultured Rhodospira sp.]